MDDDDQGSCVPAPLNIVVVGGTHGNEYTGVWCLRALANKNEKRCTTLLGNPAAVAANQRFIDDDLNRQFRASDLQNNPAVTDTVEGKRARELNELLGPKEAPKTDVIIDMHTTTCNMGLSLLIAEGDPLMAKVAAYIVKHVPHDDQGRKTRIVLHAGLDRLERPLLDSLAKHGMSIEVGPVPQGVLRHDAADVTMRAVLAALDFLEHPSSDDDDDYGLPEYVECFYGIPAVQPGEVMGKIPWPAPPSGAAAWTCGLATPNIPSYMIHKDRQDRDFEPIRTGEPLFVYHDGTVIPYSGSHGDEVYLYFINGAAYYNAKSGSGISVGAKTWYEVATATRVGTSDVATAHGM